MSLVLVILTVLFCAILILTYRTQVAEVNASLELALEQNGKLLRPGGPNAAEPPESGGNNDHKAPLPYVFAGTVLVDHAGNILAQQNLDGTMTAEQLSQAVAAVLASDDQTAKVSDMALIYAKRQTPDGIRIAFASSDHITVTVRNTALVAGFACLAAVVVFYFVSRLLAAIAIRPTAEAWAKQKQFVADASHDLRTPLTVILANTELLRQHKEDSVAAQWKWIESTEAEALQMKEMTGALIDLAQAEAATELLTLAPTNVGDLAAQAVLQFEPVAFEKSITLEAHIDPHVILNANATAFTKLLHILLDNAIKYSPAAATVTVSLNVHGKTATLSVQNLGTTIPAEELPHLFERFYRVDKARGAGGFGLGLAIAQNLAKAQHATIGVSSDEQNGTVFTVSFRL
ncbi:MAG: HAMP domain-containing histidine kinase [Clostridia bacterium]|nr:HAMP domain-containing histidine kinase [Clostridia bacterium]